MKAAVVACHPDDESLFFAGIVLSNPQIDWSIFCCTIPRADPIRASKFASACRALGASGFVLPTIEPDASKPLTHLHDLDLDEFEIVVTHNDVGEYGHVQHVSVHDYVKSKWRDKIVTGDYGKVLAGYSVYQYRLDGTFYERKLEALRCYDHVSPHDGKPKWEALLARYGSQFDLRTETYDRRL